MDKRFVKIYSQGALSGMQIWVDTETSVQYVFGISGYAGGLTVLVDAEGKPLLYKKERPKNSPEL